MDSTGSTSYAIQLESDKPLTLKNLWIYKVNGNVFARIMEKELEYDWLIAQDSFPGWHDYTSYFRVYNLDGDTLYATKMVGGASVSDSISSGGRIGYTCTTHTIRVCTYVSGFRSCYNDVQTNCTFYSGISPNATSGSFMPLNSHEPIPNR